MHCRRVKGRESGESVHASVNMPLRWEGPGALRGLGFGGQFD